jgi:hypothetical protein
VTADHEAVKACGRCKQLDYCGPYHHPINFVRCKFCYDHEFEESTNA